MPRVDPRDWGSFGTFQHGDPDDLEADALLKKLKTTATFDSKTWWRLAMNYKRRGLFELCEAALLGARYNDYNNEEVLLEWLGCFQLNRAHALSRQDMHVDASRINRALADVINSPTRLLEELNHILFEIDRPAERVR